MTRRKEPKNDFEQLVTSVSNELVEAMDALPEADEPYDAEKLSRDEQMEEYIARREDPEIWRELIQQHGLADTIRYARRFERRYQRTLDDAGE